MNIGIQKRLTHLLAVRMTEIAGGDHDELNGYFARFFARADGGHRGSSHGFQPGSAGQLIRRLIKNFRMGMDPYRTLARITL